MGFPILPHGSYTGRLKGFDGRSLYFEKEEEKKAIFAVEEIPRSRLEFKAQKSKCVAVRLA